MILRPPAGSRLQFLDPLQGEGDFAKLFDMLFVQKGRVEKRIKEGEAKYLAQFPPEERAAKRERFEQHFYLEDRLAEVLEANGELPFMPFQMKID